MAEINPKANKFIDQDTLSAQDMHPEALKFIDQDQANALATHLSQPEGTSALESALAGNLQGATLSHGPQLGGLAGAAMETAANAIGQGPDTGQSFSDLYNEYKDLQKKKISNAETAHPGAFVGGTLFGGAAGLAAGGMAGKGLGLIAPAVEGAEAPTLAARIRQGAGLGAGLGAISAQGQSEAPLLSPQMAADVAQGAETGAMTGAIATPVVEGALAGGTGLVQNAASGLKKLGKASWFSDVPETFGRGFGTDRRPPQWLLGDEAQRGVSEGVSNISTEIPQKLEQTVEGAAQLKRNIVDMAAQKGVRADPAKIDEFVEKFTAKEPDHIDPTVNSELERLQEIIQNADAKDLTDPRQLLELYNTLKNRTKFGEKNFQTPEAKYQATEAVQDIQSILRGSQENPGIAPELIPVDKDISNLNIAKEATGLDRDLNTPNQNKLIANLVNKSIGTDVNSVEAQKQLNKMIDSLKKVDPEYGAQVEKQINEMRGQMKVTGAVQERAYAGRFLATPKAWINKGSNAIGYSLGSITPDILRNAASNISRTATSQASQELSQVLINASTKDDRTRNAIMFSLMQNPGYRQLLHPYLSNQGEEEVK